MEEIMDICRTACICLMINCCIIAAASPESFIERTIFPTLEDGVDARPSPVTHISGKSTSFAVTTANNLKYNVVIPSDTNCTLSFRSSSMPDIEIRDLSGAPLPLSINTENDRHNVRFASGKQISEYAVNVSTKDKEIVLDEIKIVLSLRDSNRNGISDLVEGMMSSDARTAVKTEPISKDPHSSFFYSDYFHPGMATGTDAIILYYIGKTMNPYVYSTWRDKGYAPQMVLHSRYAGTDVPPKDADVQTDRDGRKIGVSFASKGAELKWIEVGPIDPDFEKKMEAKYGPNLTISYDYYHVPSEGRSGLAEGHYSRPMSMNLYGAGFDEPDYWSRSGYSQVFKDEWQKYYGSPWQAPHSNIDNRYKAEKLKAIMERRHIETILAGMKKLDPSVKTILEMHSQMNSQMGGFTAAYHDLTMIPALQEVVAEVWMGTSQIPTPLAGKREPRIFELGYLEYSSFHHLLRGTGKKLWFMMDPKEDMPGRAEAEYHNSFIENLLASMMFPQIDDYIPIIWPNRIYGQVSKEYETIINTVTGALCDFWQYRNGKLKSGSKGIATFISDSMGRQTSDPHPSNFDGLFGLTLPLVCKGVPVEILSLDRTAEPGYLDKFKVLLLTYEYLKPDKPEMNKAIAEWCRSGGTLVFLNKVDPYCEVKESWWRKAGYASPAEHLFEQFSIDIRGAKSIRTGDKTTELISSAKPFVSCSVPAEYAITPSPAPSGGVELLNTSDNPIVWSSGAGNGTIIYAGLPASFLSSSEDGSRLLEYITAYSMKKAGSRYTEQPYYQMDRGPFTAIRTLNKEYKLKGTYVDLLTPNLKVLVDPVIEPDACSFLRRFRPGNRSLPRIMAASGRVRATVESKKHTSAFVQTPSMTNGVVRLWKGNRDLKQAQVHTDRGEELAVDYKIEGDTIMLRYPNDSDGVVVRVDWEGEMDPSNPE